MTQSAAPDEIRALDLINAGLAHHKLCRGRDGLFLVNANDVYIGRALLAYGEFSPGEIRLFRQVLARGAVVVEVGANIGAHTVPLGRMVGANGRVIAFEPQRHQHRLLSANLALNGLDHVDARLAAAGDASGEIDVPQLDPRREENFGGVALGPGGRTEKAPLVRLDDILPTTPVSLIKIDVEGMEAQVLEGARALIGKRRPLLYVENDRMEKSAALIRLIRALGYRMWWHMPPLFEPNNFRGRPDNVFGRAFVSVNMFCAPSEIPVAIDLPEVIDENDHPMRSAAT